MTFITFHELLSRTAWHLPEKDFLFWSDKDRSLTFAEGVQVSDKVAGALSELGVEKGDRVAIFAHNGLDYVMAMFGAWKLGAISTHINVQHEDQLTFYVNDSSPKVLIYTGDKHPVIERARSQMPSVEHYICYDGKKDGSYDWSELLSAAPERPAVQVNDSDPAHLSYTSRGSGKPTGVLLAHGPTALATSCIAERLALSPADITLSPSSLASSYHLVANLLPGIHRGATIGVMTKWNADVARREIEERSVTMLVANSALLTELLELSRRQGKAPASLRVCLSGGGAVPSELKRASFDELGIFLVESYGQSELGGFVALGYPSYEEGEKLTAVGPPLPDKEVRIVDEDDNIVPVGESGEIVLRGGYMTGYWNRPEETAETLRGGWLHTGARGCMDAEGYISILERTADYS